MKPELEAFLKTNGAYGAYVTNVRKYFNKDDVKRILHRISNYKGALCFDVAFIFNATPEGHDYWRKLSDEFDKIDR